MVDGTTEKRSCLSTVYSYYGWCGIGRLPTAVVLLLWIVWVLLRALVLWFAWNLLLAHYTPVQPIPFWGALGLDPLVICERLYAVSPSIEAMREVIFKAREERR